MRGRLLPVTALALALALGACGEKSDADQVTEAIEDSYGAFAEGDADAFCASLTPDYLADFKDYWDGCDAATLERINAKVVNDADALEDPDVSEVDVKGRNADAIVNGEDLEINKIDGVWKLDDFDVPGGE